MPDLPSPTPAQRDIGALNDVPVRRARSLRIGMVVAVAVVPGLTGAGVTTLIRGADNGAAENASSIDTTSIASSRSTTATVKTSTFPPTTAEHIAPAGTAVTDGNLRFTVTSFACGVTVIGPDSTNLKPYGVFCSAALNIENVGHEEAIYQPTSDALRFKYHGPRLASDMYSTFWANHTPNWYTHTHSDPGLVTDLDPGASAAQNLVFDVAPEYDYMHAYIELREFEGGPGVLTATK